jgi:ABC-type branched-chain amino acid transport systems, ATPase component
MSAPTLRYEGVRARYGLARVLDGVTFGADAGEILAIIGRNGAGKTTALHALFGIPDVDGGSIQVGGRDVKIGRAHHVARHRVAIAPQGRRILSNLTVRENLLLGAASGHKGEWNVAKVERLFPILAEKRNDSGTSLSGGQQQMLCIGRALMSNPAVLLLDEPTEGLSPILVDHLAEVIPKISAAGAAVVLVEQHLTLVQRISDTYVVMSKGQTIADGRIEDLDPVAMRSMLGV